MAGARARAPRGARRPALAPRWNRRLPGSILGSRRPRSPCGETRPASHGRSSSGERRRRGGEILLETAAKSDAFAAVVSDGAGERIGEQDTEGAGRILAGPLQTMLTAAVTVFSNHGPPPPIVERIGLIAPRPVFLISAEHGIGNENGRQPRYYAAAGEPKQIWEVPGAKHTDGLATQPAQYERRVVEFLDEALLGG